MEWTKYTTKETLKDNDELMILDKDANANKRTLMSKIWNYVVDKMTTAVIAKLESTNKTLIGAVNELNSNKITKARLSTSNGTGKISIPYGLEGVLLANISDYNTPCFVKQSLYIIGVSKQHSEVMFEKIHGAKNYIKSISQSDGFLNFTFTQDTILCRIVFIGE